jgi:hypothetical protein
MKPSRFLIAFALLVPSLAGFEAARAQSSDKNANDAGLQCTLTVQQAPALFGMRLGMTHEQIKAAAPNLGLGRKIRKENGISTSLSTPNNEAEGVVNKYLDDKLIEIDILFGTKFQASGMWDFVLAFSKKFNLPTEAWKKKPTENRYALNCNGFTIEAWEPNHIVLFDSAAQDEIKKRVEQIAVLRKSN